MSRRRTEDDIVHDGGSPKKLRRVTRACDHCKSLKKRCSGEQPYESCRRDAIDCKYLTRYSRGLAPPPVPVATGYETPAKESGVGQNSTPTLVQDSSERPSRRESPEAASITFAGQYHGPTSAHSFLHRAWRLLDRSRANEDIPPEPEIGGRESSIFAYGDKPMGQHRFHLPHRTDSDVYLVRYFEFFMPTYRFLHRPTVTKWLATLYQESVGSLSSSLSNPRKSIVLFLLATAAIWDIDEAGKEILNPNSDRLAMCDSLFKTALDLLARERGVPCLESVQARFAAVLYLVTTSRPNQAWFEFGTTVQLAVALGLHRRSSARSPGVLQSDAISQECQKRVIWSCYTLDYYLSVMFGRPRLLHDEDLDQEFPGKINDEDLKPDGVHITVSCKDCLMIAPICHAQLARIVGRASLEQYTLSRISTTERLEIARKRNLEIERWQNDLPPFLSGVIQASSLIPVFRQQMNVLRLAYSHARILVNRPFLLYKTARDELKPHVKISVDAAREIVDIILGFMQEGHIFPFWYTQYITFNALLIIYIYIIQRKRSRIDPLDNILDEQLFSDAEITQRHLARATRLNAPSMRYSTILDELRAHAEEMITTSAASEQLAGTGLFPDDNFLPLQSEFSPFSLSSDFPLGFDFWPQIESLPHAHFG